MPIGEGGADTAARAGAARTSKTGPPIKSVPVRQARVCRDGTKMAGFSVIKHLGFT
jgi:hypothetical protein